MQPNTQLPAPDADLRAHPPRAGRDASVAGIVFLARTVDKMRAKLAGTLGPYKIGPGISMYLFEGLGISEERFEALVRESKDDAAIAAWMTANVAREKIDAVNEMLRKRGIRDADHRAQVLPNYPSIADRPELSNWLDIFDVDDAWIYDPANRGKPGSALN